MRRVLSTRKIELAHAKFASEAGVEIFEREMIGIKFNLTQKISGQVNTAHDYIVVFTSANAVKAVKAMLNEDLEIQWKVFCIGGATKEAVHATFPKSTICGTGNDGTSLASVIIHSMEPQPVTFFCGSRRRDELPRLLKENNFKVNEVEVYETVLTPSAINEPFDGIMFFSPSAAESYLSLNQIPDDVVCFSIGRTTTGYLQQYTKNKIVTAPEVSEECMINIITNYKWN